MNITLTDSFLILLIFVIAFIFIPWYLKQLGRQFASGVYEYWEEKDFIKFKDLLELPKERSLKNG